MWIGAALAAVLLSSSSWAEEAPPAGPPPLTDQDKERADHARERLREARLAIESALELLAVPARVSHEQSIVPLREAQSAVDEAVAVVDSISGAPFFTIRAQQLWWKVRREPMVRRQRNGIARKVAVPAGGWFTIKSIIDLQHAAQPIRAAKLEVTIRGMEGYQHVYEWNQSSQPIEVGDSSREDLRIFVAEEQVPSFWFKSAKKDEITAELQVRPVWVRYLNGTTREYR